MIEYVYELNFPPADQIFLESFKGFNDDHMIDNYYFRTDVTDILKPNWLNFNNLKWDLLLYFKKDNFTGHVHTDISTTLLKNPIIASKCHPYGINWVWGGDGLFEYWRNEDVDFREITTGADNNHEGVVQTFVEKSPPFKSYKMLKNKAYLVYGGLPHRATGFPGRKLMSLRTMDNQFTPWEKTIDNFKQFIV
jgi:hypothetical protein